MLNFEFKTRKGLERYPFLSFFNKKRYSEKPDPLGNAQKLLKNA